MKWIALLLYTSIVLQSGKALVVKDAANSVSFSIKNFGVKVNGTLQGLKGNIQWDAANPANSTMEVTIASNTINTGMGSRDNHLKRDDYFDVEKYPVIKFVSKKITNQAAGGFSVEGDLTIKQTTLPVAIPFTVQLQGNETVFRGSFTLQRKAFGIGGNSISMSNEVEVKLAVTAQ
ncbi:MAG: YceI family protein [Bacteroidetes bacterium]|nr:MAG: YceI family protein [Bacteroidota bacterium]TAF92256.1 MAG: YceI family protein [Bacteroidota bacterium]